MCFSSLLCYHHRFHDTHSSTKWPRPNHLTLLWHSSALLPKDTGGPRAAQEGSPDLGLPSSCNLHHLSQFLKSVLEAHEIGPNLGFVIVFSDCARGELVLSTILAGYFNKKCGSCKCKKDESQAPREMIIADLEQC